MDTPFKLRLKVGQHEFEAEGIKEDVQAQFDAWKSLISGSTAVAATPPLDQPPAPRQPAPFTPAQPEQSQANPQDAFLALFEPSGSAITLRAYPSGEQAEDAVLLVAYAFRRLQSQDILSSVLIGKSMRLSGGTIDRVDRVVNNQITRGYMMKAGGVGRGTKYRLTNTGAARAEALAKELYAQLS